MDMKIMILFLFLIYSEHVEADVYNDMMHQPNYGPQARSLTYNFARSSRPGKKLEASSFRTIDLGDARTLDSSLMFFLSSARKDICEQHHSICNQKGWIFAASRGFADLAFTAAFNLQQYTKHPILLFTNANQQQFSRYIGVNPFAAIINLDNFFVGDLKEVSSRAGFRLGKIAAMALSPLASSIYLDSDVWACDSRMDNMLNVLDQLDDIVFVKERFTHPRDPKPNGGTIGWRRTQLSDEFFLRWIVEYIEGFVSAGKTDAVGVLLDQPGLWNTLSWLSAKTGKQPTWFPAQVTPCRAGTRSFGQRNNTVFGWWRERFYISNVIDGSISKSDNWTDDSSFNEFTDESEDIYSDVYELCSSIHANPFKYRAQLQDFFQASKRPCGSKYLHKKFLGSGNTKYSAAVAE